MLYEGLCLKRSEFLKNIGDMRTIWDQAKFPQKPKDEDVGVCVTQKGCRLAIAVDQNFARMISMSFALFPLCDGRVVCVDDDFKPVKDFNLPPPSNLPK